jgi:hypothetical protein
MTEYFAVRIEDGKEVLGSDNSMFIKDLKTLSGVKNRVKKAKAINKGTYKIYRYTNVFDEDTYKLVGTVKK